MDLVNKATKFKIILYSSVLPTWLRALSQSPFRWQHCYKANLNSKCNYYKKVLPTKTWRSQFKIETSLLLKFKTEIMPNWVCKCGCSPCLRAMACVSVCITLGRATPRRVQFVRVVLLCFTPSEQRVQIRARLARCLATRAGNWIQTPAQHQSKFCVADKTLGAAFWHANKWNCSAPTARRRINKDLARGRAKKMKLLARFRANRDWKAPSRNLF